MEELAPALTGYEGVFAGINDLLEDGLGLGILSEEEEALALDGPGKTLGSVEGAVLVGSALPFVKVGSGLLALLGTPLEKAFLATLVV